MARTSAPVMARLESLETLRKCGPARRHLFPWNRPVEGKGGGGCDCDKTIRGERILEPLPGLCCTESATSPAHRALKF